MTEREQKKLLRLLELVVEVFEAAWKAVPLLFRPAGVRGKLDEASDLLEQLKQGTK